MIVSVISDLLSGSRQVRSGRLVRRAPSVTGEELLEGGAEFVQERLARLGVGFQNAGSVHAAARWYSWISAELVAALDLAGG